MWFKFKGPKGKMVKVWNQCLLVLLFLLMSLNSPGTPISPTFDPHKPMVIALDNEYDSEEETTTTSEPLPQFSEDNPRNVTVHLGSTAFLFCKVTLLNDKTVSWVKMEGAGGEVRLLTFGMHTYSNDERLSINFEQPNNWKLRVQNVESADQGDYQCQVSSHPPKSLLVVLTVIVPKISIVDDLGRPMTDKYYNSGSTLELRCIITHLPPSYTILWRQGNTTLNYDASRGGISVKTTIKKEGAISVLYIANAKANDSGPYICSLGNLTHNTIYVHVMSGETPAAMQHSDVGSLITMGKISPTLFSCLTTIISYFYLTTLLPSSSNNLLQR